MRGSPAITSLLPRMPPTAAPSISTSATEPPVHQPPLGHSLPSPSSQTRTLLSGPTSRLGCASNAASRRAAPPSLAWAASGKCAAVLGCCAREAPVADGSLTETENRSWRSSSRTKYDSPCPTLSYSGCMRAPKIGSARHIKTSPTAYGYPGTTIPKLIHSGWCTTGCAMRTMDSG